ncbi:MAG: hypothetical protein LBD82_02350 [Deltaproteobacteria bacterium]|nr:hypothetical protein [Deltaproteobacteria bacterium]
MGVRAYIIPTRASHAERGAKGLRDRNRKDKSFVGQSSKSNEEVAPMEQFLLSVLSAVLAGVIVAVIVHRMKR